MGKRGLFLAWFYIFGLFALAGVIMIGEWIRDEVKVKRLAG